MVGFHQNICFFILFYFSFSFFSEGLIGLTLIEEKVHDKIMKSMKRIYPSN